MKRKPARPTPIIRRPAAGAFSLRGNPPVMSWSIVYAPSGSAGYPDETNTGIAGIGLTVGDLTDSGSITTSSNGQIIQNLNISGQIIVEHANVTIRRCNINVPNNTVGIYNSPGAGCTGLLVEDCTITGIVPSGSGGSYQHSHTGIGVDCGGTVQRCNISRFENGIFFADPGFGGTIQDNYVHDLVYYDSGADPHIDGLQHWGGISNVTVRHNTVFANLDSSSAITYGDNNSNILIENNLFRGGFICFRIGEGGNCGTNIRILNNKFSQALDPKVGGAGLWNVGAGAVRSGNVYYESGLPVPDGA